MCELTQEVKATSSQHCHQVSHLATNLKDNQQQVLTLLATNKKQDEAETDELQRVESTFVAEVRFMVDQLELEVQQDLKTIQQNFEKSHDQLTKEHHQCYVHMASL